MLPTQSSHYKSEWAGMDSNHQSPKTPDLQSGPLPVTVYLPKILTVGLEPTTSAV